MYGSSNAAPSAAGVQSAMWTPLGTYRKAARSGGSALAAGDGAAKPKDSSHGRVTAVPRPRSTVRRVSPVISHSGGDSSYEQ